MITRKRKPKKCRICRKPFMPVRAMQPTCLSIECQKEFALAHLEKVKAREAKADRIKTKAAIASLKSLPELKAEAQKAFNAFIRARDEGKPCICCGKMAAPGYSRGGTWDCGHYRSVGSAPHLRFTESNAHRQLKQCNQHGAGRAVDYRLGLIARIGLEAVEALEADNTPRRYTKDELRFIAAAYRLKLKVLAKANQ